MKLLFISFFILNFSFAYSQCTCGEIEKLRGDIISKLDKIEKDLDKNSDTTELHDLKIKNGDLTNRKFMLESEMSKMKLQIDSSKERIKNLEKDSLENRQMLESSKKKIIEGLKIQVKLLENAGLEFPLAFIDELEKGINSIKSDEDLKNEIEILRDFKEKRAVLLKGDSLLNIKLDSVLQIKQVQKLIEDEFASSKFEFTTLEMQKKRTIKLLSEYENNLSRLCDIRQISSVMGMSAQRKREDFIILGVTDFYLAGYGFILLKIDEFMTNPDVDCTKEIIGLDCK